MMLVCRQSDNEQRFIRKQIRFRSSIDFYFNCWIYSSAKWLWRFRSSDIANIISIDNIIMRFTLSHTLQK